MTNRRNLVVNPALEVDASGWGDGGAQVPTRTAVAGFGRSFAARYTTAGFLRTPQSTVTEGVTYTLSLYLRTVIPAGGGTIYAEWVRANGSVISYSTASFSATGGNVVQRVSLTAAAPTAAVIVRVIVDGWNFAFNTTDVTMVMVAPEAALDSYGDGDTPGWEWDGTPGLSASRESPEGAPPQQPITVEGRTRSAWLLGDGVDAAWSTSRTSSAWSTGGAMLLRSTLSKETILFGPVRYLVDGVETSPTAFPVEVSLTDGSNPSTWVTAAWSTITESGRSTYWAKVTVGAGTALGVQTVGVRRAWLRITASVETPVLEAGAVRFV